MCMFGDEVVHVGELLVGGMNDEIGALGDELEVVVGEEGGDLDDRVACGVETGHLEVHPGEHRARVDGLDRVGP